MGSHFKIFVGIYQARRGEAARQSGKQSLIYALQ